jgi:hypothetical protein
MAAPSSVNVGLPSSAISFRRLFAPAFGEHVEALGAPGKSQSVVALAKMKAKSAGGQRRAAQEQNAAREHRHHLIAMNENHKRTGRCQHGHDRRDDRDDHDWKMFNFLVGS